MSAICTTPARDAGGGSRTPNGLGSPRRPQRRAFAVTPHQPKRTFGPKTPGGGLEPPQPVPKTGVLPLDDPGMRKRTRHDSNVRPQAPQACALNPTELRVRKGGRRMKRRLDEATAFGAPFVLRPSPLRSGGGGARTRGGASRPAAWRAAGPPSARRLRRGRCGSRTRRSLSAPTVFGTAWPARAQPSAPLAGAPGLEPGRAGLESASLPFSLRPRAMCQEGLEPPTPLRATALQAAAEPIRPLTRDAKKN